MDAIGGWLLNNGGNVSFGGIVVLGIWLILTGRLVPRSSVDSLRADWNERLDSKEVQVQDWKQAYFRSVDIETAQGKQIDELLEHSRATAYFIQTLASRTKEAP
jgi:hypothetical protein